MPSYRRSQTSVLPAPRSGVLKLLQDQPETFLNVLGMEVDAEGSKYTPGSDSGEWMGECWGRMRQGVACRAMAESSGPRTPSISH